MFGVLMNLEDRLIEIWPYIFTIIGWLGGIELSISICRLYLVSFPFDFQGMFSMVLISLIIMVLMSIVGYSIGRSTEAYVAEILYHKRLIEKWLEEGWDVRSLLKLDQKRLQDVLPGYRARINSLKQIESEVPNYVKYGFVDETKELLAQLKNPARYEENIAKSEVIRKKIEGIVQEEKTRELRAQKIVQVESWLQGIQRFPDRVVKLLVMLQNKPLLIEDNSQYTIFVARAESLRKRISGEGYILIDGANVMHNGKEKPRLANLELVLKKLRDEGFSYLVFTDASTRYKLEDGNEKKRFEKLLRKPHVRQVPAGTQADVWLMQYAKDMPLSKILSNDRFEEWTKEYPSVFAHPDRFVTFLIDEDTVRFASRIRKK